MVPGVPVPGNDGRLRSAYYARQRREDLGLTQAEVAAGAGVRDVKTIRNFETGRNWPNDLTRRGIETALRVEVGTLDRLAGGGGTYGGIEPGPPAGARGSYSLPTAQELIDLSSAISKLSQAHEAMITRRADDTAAQIRGLMDTLSSVMAGYRPALEQAASHVDVPGSGPAAPTGGAVT